jgi:hypothetical protein
MLNQRYLKGLAEYQSARQQHWDEVALSLEGWKGWGKYYHRRLRELYRQIIPEGHKVLEIGCGDGGLLSSVAPSRGVGHDLSSAMCQKAKGLHPELDIIQADAHYLPLREKFDYILLSDLLNDLWDVQQLLKGLRKLSHQRTRVIINLYSRLWEIPLDLAQKLRLAKPNLPQNWLTPLDIQRLLQLEDFEVIRSTPEIIFPLSLPLITPFLNRFLGKFWPFKLFSLTNLIIARPAPGAELPSPPPTVSVIIPARNESGNIEALFLRTPDMGGGTELIFVEGHSLDDTYDSILGCLDRYPERNASVFQQSGKGKGDAVRLGFDNASGDVLMILDADLSVPPEDLVLFYQALAANKGEFINGVRLVYPMEDQAMRFLNMLGNKFFSLSFSWLINQPVKDTLCGTKVLYRRDYLEIKANRAYFGEFDPFGDFDLLFGAARLNLKIVDLPIRYRNRTYGQTNIQRFRHGLLLFRMLGIAAVKLKFI